MRPVPRGVVTDLVKQAAADQGLRALTTLLGEQTFVRCVLCYPNGVEVGDGEWGPRRTVNLVSYGPGWAPPKDGGCKDEGAVTITWTVSGGRETLVDADRMLAEAEVACCCHDAGDALARWEWRTDVAARVARAIEANSQWAKFYAIQQDRREAQQRYERAARAVSLAAARLTHHERVQVVREVLTEAGLRVRVEQAKVWWECGHIEDDGSWSVQALIVGEGVPQVTEDSCTKHSYPLGLATLLAKYGAVAALDDKARAAFRARAERTGERRGRRPGGTSGSRPAKEATEPRVEWDAASTRAWLVEHGVPMDLAIQPMMRWMEEHADPTIAKGHPPRRWLGPAKAAADPS